MTQLVPIVLAGWIIAVQAIFTLTTPRRAVIASFLAGWMFLPQASITFPGIPDLTKVSSTAVGVLIGIALFDVQRFTNFKARWIDIPMLVWCFSPIGAAATNLEALTLYDGLSASLDQFIIWGVPYFVGRLYFDSLEALRELAIGLVIAGLVYAPLCIWEMRMSPQLHRMLYGYHPTRFLMTLRFGGYRPMVFMQHGLMLAMWMTACTIVTGWMWSTGALRRIGPVPLSLGTAGLFGISILCRSIGAGLLLVGGTVLLFALRYLRSTALIAAIFLAPAFYLTLRIGASWDGAEAIALLEEVLPEKAGSLAVRLDNEQMIVQHTMDRPIFGWGRWGRWRIRDEVTGRDITISDSMWIISLGQTGLVGMTSLTLALMLPGLMLMRKIPPRFWHLAPAAPAGALAMVLYLYTIDNLLNAMVNPAFVLIAGAVACYATARRAPQPVFASSAARAPDSQFGRAV